MNAENNQTKVELTKDKDCKGSIRFATENPKAPVSNVYVSREMPGINTASKVIITIEVIQ